MLPTVDDWAREALAALARLEGVRRAGLALTEGGGRRLLFAATDRDNAHGVDWCHIDAYLDVPLNRAIATGATVAGGRSALADRYPDFVAQQPASVAALAAVPIRAGRQVLGGLVVYLDTETALRPADLAALGAALGERLMAAQQRRVRTDVSLASAPVTEGARAATHLVPGIPEAVAPARAFVGATLTAWGVDRLATEDAVLLTSELVTNALVHSVSDCEVRLLLEGPILTVTVRDGGGEPLDPATTADPARVHGRGLQLVEALSTRWGSDLDEIGTTVWFELALGRA